MNSGGGLGIFSFSIAAFGVMQAGGDEFGNSRSRLVWLNQPKKMQHHKLNPEHLALTRREFLSRCGMGMGALGLAS
ncbi:MAG: twin-arginine translocation signal domain-containing protein, partial [Verrucomicrobiota bacterium]